MKCPTCNGKGEMVGLFPVWAEDVPPEKRKPYSILPCYRCKGEGIVPDEMLDWMREGQTLKDRRIAKRLTLRKAAKFLDMDGCTLSEMETGRIKPDLNIKY